MSTSHCAWRWTEPLTLCPRRRSKKPGSRVPTTMRSALRCCASSTIASAASPIPSTDSARTPRSASSFVAPSSNDSCASGGSAGSPEPPPCTAPPNLVETLVTITLDPKAAAMAAARSSARFEASVPSYPSTIVFMCPPPQERQGNTTTLAERCKPDLFLREPCGCPYEAAGPLANTACRSLVPPSSYFGTLGAEDEQARAAFSDELQECVDRVRAADAQPLDPHGERLGKLGRFAQLALEILPLDVAVPEQAPACGHDLRHVDDHERLSTLHGRVDGEHGRLLGERNVERGEEHGPSAGRDEGYVLAWTVAPQSQHATRGGAAIAVCRALCGGTCAASTEGTGRARTPSPPERP